MRQPRRRAGPAFSRIAPPGSRAGETAARRRPDTDVCSGDDSVRPRPAPGQAGTERPFVAPDRASRPHSRPVRIPAGSRSVTPIPFVMGATFRVAGHFHETVLLSPVRGWSHACPPSQGPWRGSLHRQASMNRRDAANWFRTVFRCPVVPCGSDPGLLPSKSLRRGTKTLLPDGLDASPQTYSQTASKAHV